MERKTCIFAVGYSGSVSWFNEMSPCVKFTRKTSLVNVNNSMAISTKRSCKKKKKIVIKKDLLPIQFAATCRFCNESALMKWFVTSGC